MHLQLKSKLEDANWKEKIRVQNNAVMLIKNATRKQNPFDNVDVSNVDGNSYANSFIGGASNKPRGIIKIRQ